MTKEELDKATGELIIAIGNGTFRDAVAMLVDRVSREAYIHGTESAHSAAKNVIDHRWQEFDELYAKAVFGGAEWHCAAMAANRVRTLMV